MRSATHSSVVILGAYDVSDRVVNMTWANSIGLSIRVMFTKHLTKTVGVEK